MDFLTFTDAYSHNKRSKEHLINLIKTRADKTPEFSLFLGSGSSVTSGVKSASDMISDWRRKLFASNKGKEQYDEWLKSQDWYNADDEYSKLFEMVYDQPTQRRSYIERAIKKSKPGWGYAYLTSLIEKNLFNVIFTTNFDDLLNEACYRFTNNLRPMVCAHDSAVSSIRLMSDRPKVIKLHGDFLYDSIKNTSSELQSLEANMREKFIEFAKEYGLIVVGYAGNDQSVMDLLDVLIRSSNYYRNGIYWCIKKSSSPSHRLCQLLRNDRIYWIEIDGFDEFMAEISEANNISLPDGILAPHRTALDRNHHLLKISKSFNCPTLINSKSDLKEIYSKVDNALSEVGLGEWYLQKEDTKDPLLELTDKALPFWQSVNYIDDGEYAKAKDILLRLVEDKNSKFAKSAWNHLLKCLLMDKKYHDEAKNLLLEIPPVNWQDSTHYLYRSYYSLYLNMHNEALSFADRSLEMNSDLAPAKVNKTLALFMDNKDKEAKVLLKYLKSEKCAEHHRAAAFAMEGDINKSISLLQKSFVLGRYSPSDVCKDIVFRIFWGLPYFEEKLKPFILKKPVKYPYKDICPMSEYEKKMRTSVEEKLANG